MTSHRVTEWSCYNEVTVTESQHVTKKSADEHEDCKGTALVSLR